MLKADIQIDKAPILNLDPEEKLMKLNSTDIVLREGYEIIYKNGVITLKGELVLNGVETIEHARKYRTLEPMQVK